jgi:small subunit ribosomal protein S24e
MEIEIESKRNNPLLNRTEVYFIVKHPGEGTPNREIIRSELADKLNVKKENIIVNTIKSGFGIQEISGYAKVYSSVQKTKSLEQDYILTRNKLLEKDKKGKKESTTGPTEQAPKPPDETKPEEPITPPIEEAKNETSEPSAEQESPMEEPSETKKEEAPVEQTIKSEPTEEKQNKENTEPEKAKEEKKEE